MATRSDAIRLDGVGTQRGTGVASLLRPLVRTDAGSTGTLARVVLGGVMLPHGLQKAFGLFGGYGFEGTMGFLTGGVGLPWAIAFLVIAIETAGALALLLGAFGRLAAVGIIAVMIGAVATTHASVGFFMDWGGTLSGEGFEYHLLAIGLALIVVLRGSGAASVDGAIARRIAG